MVMIMCKFTANSQICDIKFKKYLTFFQMAVSVRIKMLLRVHIIIVLLHLVT